MAINLVKFLIIICAFLEISTITTLLTEDDKIIEIVKNDCKRKLDFKTIGDFNKFLADFKWLEGNSATIIQLDPILKRCFVHKDSLYALGELVSDYDKKRPCKFEQIAKLEDYARKHLLGNKKSLALKFFTLFGVNIGYKCKLNLLAHLSQADSEVDQVDFIYSMASPTGWNTLINEHTKKSMKFGTSSYGEANIINRVAKLVPGFNQIDQLDYMSFDHPLNKISLSNWNGIESFPYKFEDSLFAGKMNEYLNRIIQSCQNLDQFYLNSVLSLARLNELGLLIEFKMIDEAHEQSLTLHKWLSAASFCQLMIRVNTEIANDKIKVQIIHDDSLIVSRRKLYSYAAEFEEINKEVAKEAWRASILEAAWVKKNQAMFGSHDDGIESFAMKQLKQFIKGLERDHRESRSMQLV